MPKVSVIIPTYNRPELLEKAIFSVLSQTFQDFELLIVDDASTENCRDIVNGFKDDRIKYIRNEHNKGIAAVRNIGVKNSSGEYIAFLDDDDEWLPHKLEKQVELLDQSNAQLGAVYTGTFSYDGASEKILRETKPRFRGEILKELLLYNFIVTSSTLFKRSCFEKVGYYDENLSFAEDYDMWIRIAKVFEFDYVGEPLIRYRIHQNKLTKNYEAVISGLELLLTKHHELFSKNERAYSDYKLRLGIFYCYNGDTRKGRKVFIQAIKIYPFNIKHYYNFALSVLGTGAFMKIKIYRSNLMRALRGLNYR